MHNLPIKRHPFVMFPESSRVIIRPFIPSITQRILTRLILSFTMSDKVTAIVSLQLEELLDAIKS